MNKYIKINECKENMERATLKIKKIRKKAKRKNITRACAALAIATIWTKIMCGSWPIYKDNIKHYLVTETLMDNKGNIEYVNNTYDNSPLSLDKGLLTPESNTVVKCYDLNAKYMENDEYEYNTYNLSNESDINMEEIKNLITENSDYQTLVSLKSLSRSSESRMEVWSQIELEEKDIPFFKESSIQYKIMERHPEEYSIKPESDFLNKAATAVWVIHGMVAMLIWYYLKKDVTKEIRDLQDEIKRNEAMIKSYEEEDLKRKLKKRENWEEQ